MIKKCSLAVIGKVSAPASRIQVYVRGLDRLSMAARVLVEHFIQAASGASQPP
jgi:hypothetical protein